MPRSRVPKFCTVEACAKPRHTRGFCQGHAKMEERGVDPYTGSALGMGKFKYLGKECVVLDCESDARVKGMCQLHYRREFHDRPLNLPYGSTEYGKLWKQIKYVSAHARCRKMWGRAAQHLCVSCGKQAREWAYDGTDPTEIYAAIENGDRPTSKVRYSRFPEFYKPMCAKCHKTVDKRLAAQELEEYREWKHQTGLTLKDLTFPPTSGGSESF